MEKLRVELARLLEIPVSDLTDGAPLAGFGNWDSLTQVSVIAYAVGNSPDEPDAGALAAAETFKDLANALQVR